MLINTEDIVEGKSRNGNTEWRKTLQELPLHNSITLLCNRRFLLRMYLRLKFLLSFVRQVCHSCAAVVFKCNYKHQTVTERSQCEGDAAEGRVILLYMQST